MDNANNTYITKLNKNIKREETKARNKPFLGQKECKALDVPTFTNIFSKGKAEGKALNKKKTTEEKVQETFSIKADAIWFLFDNIWKKEIKPRQLHFIARLVGQSIYELNPTWSGYSSQTLLDQNIKHTNEHFYPRMWAGWIYVNYVIEHKGIPFDLSMNIMNVFRQVHRTTDIENTKLRPYQKYNSFIGWRESYISANIELVQTKEVHIVDIGDVLPNYHKYLC